MDYFKLAVDLTRQEASECKADLLAKAAIKTIALRSIKGKQEVCCCSSYEFPHRMGSGKCPGNPHLTSKTLEEIEAESLALFDAIEARAINRGF